MTANPRNGTERATMTAQYADSTNLCARASIYQFQQPPIDLAQEVLQSTNWEDAAFAVDVGCGSGFHLAGLARRSNKAVGVDLSQGMAAESRTVTGAPTLVGDVAALPFATGTADRLLAAHMLYHAPEPEGAVAELRRVLRSGGVAVVVTNGDAHLARLDELRNLAVGIDVGMVFRNFSASTGRPVLERHFRQVELRLIRSELVLTSAAPVVAYVDSARYLVSRDVTDSTWTEALASIHDEVEAVIARDGSYRCPTEVGIFTCA